MIASHQQVSPGLAPTGAIAMMSAVLTASQPPQAHPCPSLGSLQSPAVPSVEPRFPFPHLSSIRTAADVAKVVADFAHASGSTPILPHLVPHQVERKAAIDYAREHAAASLDPRTPDVFHSVQLGDLILWRAVDAAGEVRTGLTYVSPSHTLHVDLVIGLVTCTDDGMEQVDDDLIARFTLICHCLAVPKNKQLLLDASSSFKPLSPREHQVLKASAQGATAKQVSSIVGISERTVTAHIQSCMAKLDCATKTQAVIRALRLGLI